MKSIEQLSETAVKRRLKALYSRAQDMLSQAQLDERTALEARQHELQVEKHPPIHTPANFIEKDEDWQPTTIHAQPLL